MKKKGLLLALSAGMMVWLCGCGGETVQEPEESNVVPSEPVIVEPEPEPVVVYPGAVEEYLLPVEDFSWEREFAPEYVMLHFASAVVPSPGDPYDMELIRSVFADYGVSIHYIIDREGTVYCCVPEDRVAWHAGAGEWAGDEKYTNKMNSYAIGIEMLAIGSQSDMEQYLSAAEYQQLDPALIGYTEEQYEALAALVEDVCGRNGIPMDRAHVIGHQEYNPDKNDPGELFDWSRLLPEEE